jgi:hypothetical protein
VNKNSGPESSVRSFDAGAQRRRSAMETTGTTTVTQQTKRNDRRVENIIGPSVAQVPSLVKAAPSGIAFCNRHWRIAAA